MVVSARLGNEFITSPNTDERPCIYVYMIDDDHFHAITSITGFFNAMYLCNRCHIHFDHRERRECETKCIVCKKDKCLKTDNTVTCNMVCRSREYYEERRKGPAGLSRQRDDDQRKQVSQRGTWWKCPTCYKVINMTTRKIERHRCGEYVCSSCHTYVLDGHLCYMRATPYKLILSEFIFFFISNVVKAKYWNVKKVTARIGKPDVRTARPRGVEKRLIVQISS